MMKRRGERVTNPVDHGARHKRRIRQTKRTTAVIKPGRLPLVFIITYYVISTSRLVMIYDTFEASTPRN